MALFSRLCEDRYLGTIFRDKSSAEETTETALATLIGMDGKIDEVTEETTRDGVKLLDDVVVDRIGGKLLVNELNRSQAIDLFTNSVNCSMILHSFIEIRRIDCSDVALN